MGEQILATHEILDRAYWITWYDIADENHAEYLSWLHNSYIPKRLESSDILHAAHYQSGCGAGKSCASNTNCLKTLKLYNGSHQRFDTVRGKYLG